MDRRAEHGGMIVSSLLRMAAWLTLFCVLAFDAGGIITNRVLLDEAARVAASHAVQAFQQAGGERNASAAPLNRAEEAAADSLSDQPGIELQSVSVDDGVLTLVARRRARVLLADRVPPLRDQVHAEATATASTDED